MVKVLLADAQYLTRAGIAKIVEKSPNMELVAEVEGSASLQQELSKNSVDIVVLDYNQPGHFTLEDIADIKRKSPNTQIMVVTQDTDGGNIFKALKSGVNCMVTKNCSKGEILNAMQATSRGEKFFCNSILDVIIEKQMPGKEESGCEPTRLTTRELEIVELIASGIKTRDMADQLNLSTHTIYTHRKNIMKKLGINSVSELILHAVNSGIIARA